MELGVGHDNDYFTDYLVPNVILRNMDKMIIEVEGGKFRIATYYNKYACAKSVWYQLGKKSEYTFIPQ